MLFDPGADYARTGGAVAVRKTGIFAVF